MLVLSEPRFVLKCRDLVVEAPADMRRHEVALRLLDLVGDMLKDRQAEAQQDGDESSYLRLESAERAVRFAASSVATTSPVDEEEIQETDCAGNGNGQLLHDLEGLDRRQFPLRAVTGREQRAGEQFDTLKCGHVRSIPEGHPLDSASRRCGDCYVESLGS